MSARSYKWCFTINNWNNEHVQRLQSLQYRYLVYGREHGPINGTPHLQGFVILQAPRRLSTLRAEVGGGHWEIARSEPQAASNYCKKDGDFDEFGTLPSGQGKRKDIDRIIEWLDEFIADNGRAPTVREIAQHQPIAMLRYRNFHALATARAPEPSLAVVGDPTDWQSELLQYVDDPASDRSIRFYVDEEGGKGKSWIQDRMFSEMPERVQLLSVGKIADIAYSIETDKDIFLFNVGRDCMQYVQYSILEALKDRRIYSSKYESRMKILQNRPHVIVFSNEMPDMSKLTLDRYDIKEL